MTKSIHRYMCLSTTLTEGPLDSYWITGAGVQKIIWAGIFSFVQVVCKMFLLLRFQDGVWTCLEEHIFFCYICLSLKKAALSYYSSLFIRNGEKASLMRYSSGFSTRIHRRILQIATVRELLKVQDPWWSRVGDVVMAQSIPSVPIPPPPPPGNLLGICHLVGPGGREFVRKPLPRACGICQFF